jgi:hypothetical protein
VDEATQLLLALAERLFGAFALGHVPIESDVPATFGTDTNRNVVPFEPSSVRHRHRLSDQDPILPNAIGRKSATLDIDDAHQDIGRFGQGCDFHNPDDSLDGGDGQSIGLLIQFENYEKISGRHNRLFLKRFLLQFSFDRSLSLAFRKRQSETNTTNEIISVLTRENTTAR